MLLCCLELWSVNTALDISIWTALKQMDSVKTRRTDKGQCGVSHSVPIGCFVGGYYLYLKWLLRALKSFLCPHIFKNGNVIFTYSLLRRLLCLYWLGLWCKWQKGLFAAFFWEVLYLYIMLVVLNSESCLYVQITIHTVHLFQCTLAVFNRLLWFKRCGIVQRSIDIWGI